MRRYHLQAPKTAPIRNQIYGTWVRNFCFRNRGNIHCSSGSLSVRKCPLVKPPHVWRQVTAARADGSSQDMGSANKKTVSGKRGDEVMGSDRKLASGVQEGLHGEGPPPRGAPQRKWGLVTGLRKAGDVHRRPDEEEERAWWVQEQ